MPSRATATSKPSSASGLGGVDGREQPLAQHAELQVVEELVHLLAVPLLAGQVVELDLEVDVADELGEPAVAARRCARCSRSASPTLPLTVSTLVDQRAQRAVLADPLRRGLLAHARDAGQVVARVAAQRGEVGVLRRRQPVLVLDLLGREPGHLADAALRVEHRDVVVDQLQRVPVAGADQDVDAGGRGLRGDRGDDVVGLEPAAPS